MRKETGALFLGIGLAVISIVLPTQVDTMPVAAAIAGYVVGGLLILYGTTIFITPIGRLWRFIMGLQFHVPITYTAKQPNGKTSDVTIASSLTKADTEELLNFYSIQRENWQNNAVIELLRVDYDGINEAEPYVTFRMAIHNYLPVRFKLVSIIESEGVVGSPDAGQHKLPSFNGEQDVSVRRCAGNSFPVKIHFYGELVNILRKEKESLTTRGLTWSIKAVWKVEIFGEVRNAWTQSHEMHWQAPPNVPPNIQQSVIEHYQDRTAMEAVRGGIANELKGVSSAWVAWGSGIHYNQMDETQKQKIEKMVMVNPHCALFGVLALVDTETVGKTEAELVIESKKAKYSALAKGTDVRYSERPIMYVVIGDPESPNAWARILHYLPSTDSTFWPNFVVYKNRKEEEGIFEAIKNAYIEMFRTSRQVSAEGR